LISLKSIFQAKKRLHARRLDETSARQILCNVLQAALKEILHPLRLLKSKTRLQFADVQYILFTSPVLRDPEAAILLGRLLLVFLCDALGGHVVFKDVLQLVRN